MDTSNFTDSVPTESTNESLTPTEAYLSQRFGDGYESYLHDLIANGHTQSEIAHKISTDRFPVSRSWVASWMRGQGYTRHWRRLS